MEHVDFTYTAGMDEAQVDQRLRDTETGVLSLADDDDAYAIPLAFHYDGGDALLLRLGRFADSEKMAYLESTRRACFVLYGYESPRESWSVLVTGELHPVPPGDDRYEDAAVNRAFPDLRVFDEDVAEIEIELYELRMETVTGRETLGRLAEAHPHGKMLAGAGAAVAVCGRPDISPDYWVQDCSAATENLLVAAAALGLGAVWLGVHPREDRAAAVRQVLGIPEEIPVLSLLSIGHPAEEKEPRTQYDETRVHREKWQV